MADTLKYRTITGLSGNNSITTGLNLAQIIKVSRQGEQKDYAGFIGLSSLDGSNWAFLPVGRRISFGTNFPFQGNEQIMIIYKETI